MSNLRVCRRGIRTFAKLCRPQPIVKRIRQSVSAATTTRVHDLVAVIIQMPDRSVPHERSRGIREAVVAQVVEYEGTLRETLTSVLWN